MRKSYNNQHTFSLDRRAHSNFYYPFSQHPNMLKIKGAAGGLD